MKRILGVEEYVPGIVIVRLEATKRRKVWMKVEKTNLSPSCSCTPTKCQLYNKCGRMKSPLRKYYNFGQFCNHLFVEYPELKKELGVENINQVVPIKRIGT